MKKIKKITILSCLLGGLLLSISAQAACTLGKEITNGSHTYCQSYVNMNWFSAVAWCHAQNRRLATYAQVCPNNSCWGWHQSGIDNSWIGTLKDSKEAYAIGSNTTLFTSPRSSGMRAFCW